MTPLTLRTWYKHRLPTPTSPAFDPLTPESRLTIFYLLITYALLATAFWLTRLISLRYRPSHPTGAAALSPDFRHKATMLTTVAIMNIVVETLLLLVLVYTIVLFRVRKRGTGTFLVVFAAATAYWVVVFGFGFWWGKYLFLNLVVGGPMLGLSLGWLVYFCVVNARARKSKFVG